MSEICRVSPAAQLTWPEALAPHPMAFEGVCRDHIACELIEGQSVAADNRGAAASAAWATTAAAEEAMTFAVVPSTRRSSSDDFLQPSQVLKADIARG
jgi:hypothetical protein